jgi:hypothetical protein
MGGKGAAGNCKAWFQMAPSLERQMSCPMLTHISGPQPASNTTLAWPLALPKGAVVVAEVQVEPFAE